MDRRPRGQNVEVCHPTDSIARGQNRRLRSRINRQGIVERQLRVLRKPSRSESIIARGEWIRVYLPPYGVQISILETPRPVIGILRSQWYDLRGCDVGLVVRKSRQVNA